MGYGDPRGGDRGQAATPMTERGMTTAAEKRWAAAQTAAAAPSASATADTTATKSAPWSTAETR